MASQIKVDTISEKTSANGVTIDSVSLKDGKVATANSIDSDAYVDGSIDTAHIADLNVTTAKIAADAITAAKIADDAISEEHLDASVITGLTALSAEPADTDEFLISDAGTLKKMDYSHIKGGGAWTLIASQTASDSASVEFDGNLTDTYNVYKLFGDNVVGATDGVYLNFTFKRDGEGSYNTGSSDYKWVAERFRTGNSLGTRVEDTSDAVMRGRCDVGSSTGELVNFETTIYPRSGKYPTICTRETGMDSADDLGQFMSVGRLNTAADCQSIKVAMSSGNIATGNFRLYGLALS